MMNLFGIETQQKNLFNYRWYLKNGFPQSIDNSVKQTKSRNGKVCFLTGMSVPPVMAANIAYQIKIQILDKVAR